MCVLENPQTPTGRFISKKIFKIITRILLLTAMCTLFTSHNISFKSRFGACYFAINLNWMQNSAFNHWTTRDCQLITFGLLNWLEGIQHILWNTSKTIYTWIFRYPVNNHDILLYIYFKIHVNGAVIESGMEYGDQAMQNFKSVIANRFWYRFLYRDMRDLCVMLLLWLFLFSSMNYVEWFESNLYKYCHCFQIEISFGINPAMYGYLRISGLHRRWMCIRNIGIARSKLMCFFFIILCSI